MALSISPSDPGYSDALAAQLADEAAQRAYLDAQRAGLNASAATAAAAEKWKETYDQATLTGYYNGQPTLAREGQENANALDLMKVATTLRGPQNYFQYSKVLNGTPQGLRDILGAAAGRLRIPGFGGGLTGAAATSPGGVVPAGTGPVNKTGQDYFPGGGAAQAIGPNGQLNVAAAASNPAPASSPIAPHVAAPLEAASLGGLVSDLANPAQTMPYAGYEKDLVNPNQIDPRAWAHFSPTQKALDLGAYEQQGWDPNDVQYLYNRSLPQYGGAQRGQVTGIFGQ